MAGAARRLALVVAVLSLAVAGVAGPAGAAPPPPDPGPNGGCLLPRRVDIAPPPPTYEGTSATPVTNDLVFTVTSMGCAVPGTVGFQTLGVMADSSDFVPYSGTLTFAAGDMSKRTIVVRVWQDAQQERDENVMVLLCPSSEGIKLGTFAAEAWILNDDRETLPGRWQADPHCSR